MKIIKTGKIPTTKIKFHCNYCGCVFVAVKHETETQPIPTLAYQRNEVDRESDIDGCLHFCKCPTCDKKCGYGVRYKEEHHG